MEYIIHEDEYLLAYTRNNEIFIRSWNSDREMYDYLHADNVPFENLSTMWRAVRAYAKANTESFCRSHKQSKALNRLEKELHERNSSNFKT